MNLVLTLWFPIGGKTVEQMNGVSEIIYGEESIYFVQKGFDDLEVQTEVSKVNIEKIEIVAF